MDPQIIAAVIGAVATIAAVVIAWWLHERRGHLKSSGRTKPIKEDVGEELPHAEKRFNLKADSNVHKTSAKLARSVSKITAKEIIETINSASPFQKDQIAKQYNGIQVKWIGYLKEVSEYPRDKNSVRVNLNVDRDAIVGTSIWFTEKISNFPEIRTLKRGSEISVTGEIIGASGQGLCVDIRPTSIEVLHAHA